MFLHPREGIGRYGICMRVCMVCVSPHVFKKFLPLTPCIRLELALTVHWAHRDLLIVNMIT